MKGWVATAVAVAVCAVPLAACGGSSGSSGFGGGGGSPSAFCNAQANTTGPADIASGALSESKDNFSKAASDAKELVGQAPAEIRADVRKVSDALQEAADHGTAAWEDSSVQAAWHRVGSWVATNCR